jgi:DNA-binding MarR family transcriptional regulator
MQIRSKLRSRRHRYWVGTVDYASLADLRYLLRRFMRVREVAARAAGVQPQQYLLLLQVKGLQGRADPTIGVLADRLQIRHHAAVQLVDRLVDRGLVERRRDGSVPRGVVVALTARAEQLLEGLARRSVTELTTEGPSLVASLNRLIRRSTARRRAPPRDTRRTQP